jgi:hypothetical protein
LCACSFDEDGTLISVAVGAITNVDSDLRLGGTIMGRVTTVVTGTALANVSLQLYGSPQSVTTCLPEMTVRIPSTD